MAVTSYNLEVMFNCCCCYQLEIKDELYNGSDDGEQKALNHFSNFAFI
jgi:hypothetical protein